jgi:hypothetical protein
MVLLEAELTREEAFAAAAALAAIPAPSPSPERSPSPEDAPDDDAARRKLVIQLQIAKLEKQLKAKERGARIKQREAVPVLKTKKPLVLGAFPYLPRYFFVRLSPTTSLFPLYLPHA